MRTVVIAALLLAMDTVGFPPFEVLPPFVNLMPVNRCGCPGTVVHLRSVPPRDPAGRLSAIVVPHGLTARPFASLAQPAPVMVRALTNVIPVVHLQLPAGITTVSSFL